MEVSRAVYILCEGCRLSDWLERYWSGEAPFGDPLRHLYLPHDLRGEVRAWGGPHWTLLDALTTCKAEGFDSVVREVCRRHPRPTIRPTELVIWPTPRWEGARLVGGSSLVLRCESPELSALQEDLVAAARPYLHRLPLADEEWQRAVWWIQQVGGTVQANLEVLHEAERRYREAQSPALPSSRHFRLDRLVRLVRSIREAPTESHQAAREEALAHFFTFGEPPWSLEKNRLHLSIATGLSGHSMEREWIEQIFQRARELFENYTPATVAVMESAPDSRVTVRMSDALTGEKVTETRPGFRVRERVPFRT